MKLILNKDDVEIVPENIQDHIYLQTVLGIEKSFDKCHAGGLIVDSYVGVQLWKAKKET